MQDEQIAAVLEQEGGRLRSFIRRQVPDPSDVDDILQDVFGELVEAYRLMKPIERMGAWLFRVAQNRITDLFRKKKPEPLPRRSFPPRDALTSMCTTVGATASAAVVTALE